jgi:hypothetical protein
MFIGLRKHGYVGPMTPRFVCSAERPALATCLVSGSIRIETLCGCAGPRSELSRLMPDTRCRSYRCILVDFRGLVHTILS